jgi:hypothetical protein
MDFAAGTNTPARLDDPLGLGLRRPRPSTEELYAFGDEFVEAVRPSDASHKDPVSDPREVSGYVLPVPRRTSRSFPGPRPRLAKHGTHTRRASGERY